VVHGSLDQVFEARGRYGHAFSVACLRLWHGRQRGPGDKSFDRGTVEAGAAERRCHVPGLDRLVSFCLLLPSRTVRTWR
jgi:hypothetical protein